MICWIIARFRVPDSFGNLFDGAGECLSKPESGSGYGMGGGSGMGYHDSEDGAGYYYDDGAGDGFTGGSGKGSCARTLSQSLQKNLTDNGKGKIESWGHLIFWCICSNDPLGFGTNTTNKIRWSWK